MKTLTVFVLALLVTACATVKLDSVEKKYAAAYKAVEVGYSTLERVVRSKKADGTPVLTRAQAEFAHDCLTKAKKAVETAQAASATPSTTVVDKIAKVVNTLIDALDAALGGQGVLLKCEVT
jgi:hypothetical protein